MTSDNIAELIPFRADLTKALARRGERLLESTDLAAEVAALESLEAYYVVKEIGLDTALPILSELSHEQLETCIDLDCWHGSDFGIDSLDQWLKSFAQSGPEGLARGFFTLDHVVQLLFLSKTVTVYDPDTDQIPPINEESDDPRVTTPDGFFILDLKSAIPLIIHPYILLDALYKHDPIASHQLLRQIRVELPMLIEEEALRFRNGRMEDIGFVPPEEAAMLFSRPPSRPQPLYRHLKPLPPSPLPTQIPSLYAAPLEENTLLQRALLLITDREELLRIEQEIIWAINSAFIAYGERTRDIKQITDITERVRDTISLGLAALISGQEADCSANSPAAAAKAAALLSIWTITDLFRHGFAATIPIRKAVNRALLEPKVLAWYNLADTAQSDEPGDRLERAFISALCAPHPLHSGFDLNRAERLKAFTSLAEIGDAQVRLQQLVARLCASK